MVSDIMAERLTSHTAASRDHPCLPGKVLEGITPTCQARKHLSATLFVRVELHTIN